MQFKDMMTLRKDPHNLLAVCIGIRIASRRPVSQKEREKNTQWAHRFCMNSSSKGIRTWITLPYHFHSRTEKISPSLEGTLCSHGERHHFVA